MLEISREFVLCENFGSSVENPFKIELITAEMWIANSRFKSVLSFKESRFKNTEKKKI